MKRDTKSKTNQGGFETFYKNFSNDKRMYATGTDTCPVKMLQLMISKTDKNAKFLFNQYHKDAAKFPSDDVWYSTKHLAKRTFARFMSEICRTTRTESKYTAHCLRATSVQQFSDMGFKARHIMYVSNHRSESSLRSYNTKLSTEQKKSFSCALLSLTNPKTALAPRVNSNPTEMKSAARSNLPQYVIYSQ